MSPILESPSGDSDQFRKLLDEQNDWPAPYTFKFIVPQERFDELTDRLGEHPFETRSSSKGNYVSVTLRPIMDSSQSVIDLYERVGGIDGIVAL